MSDVNKILRELTKQGFTYRITGGGHYMVHSADGQFVTVMPKTPSDYRGRKNAIAALRRAGFRWGGR